MKKLLGVILWLQMDWSSGEMNVEQRPPSLSTQEGEGCVFYCNYSSTISVRLHWYRQHSGRRLESLFLLLSNGAVKQEGQLTASLDTKARLSTLHIAASQRGLAATYFCAVETTSGSRIIFGKGTQLMVNFVIHQPDPSVYKLRGPKSSNTSVCLLTDFASQDNVTQEMKHMVFRSGSTALDVKAMDSKSNGALAWSNSINFQCNSTFETYAFYPSSEYSCDAKLVEKSFETDMNLNFQNLSVIALRILLLKVAGFNLLMTLRLWSS